MPPKKGIKQDGDETGPLRRCIASGESLPSEGLIRFVVSPDGALVPDLAAELPGRGLWMTAHRDALTKALAGKGFSRAARRQITVPPDFGDQITALLLRRTMQLLGIARKAGVAICGREKVEAQARAGKIGVLIAAADGSEDGKTKLLRLAKAVTPDIYYVSWLSAAELSLAFGRENVIHAAIAKGRLADRFLIEADRLLGFRGKSG
ncbi:MAG: RNA-binding protein [Alphaproteobacteria bacterium]|nr:RNA-binding protein [Alphaproteobacteria bacterium]